MTDQSPSPLVDVDWLAARLGDPGLVILDASWHMPAAGRDGEAEYAQEHLPGARFFDFDRKIRDCESPLPHMLPSAEAFAREVRALGVNSDSDVVCYDSQGIFSAPRAWWMFRAMGHRRVHVLDGGLPAWRGAGLPLEAGPGPSPAAGSFVARPDPTRLARLDDVRAAIGQPGQVIVDARSAGRFFGREPEPRAGLRGGHIPGSRNLPFSVLLANGRYLPEEALADLLAPLIPPHMPLDGQVICTCGSGVSACVIALAAELIGRTRVAVYDGSWTEWGGRADTPVSTAPDAGSCAA